VIVSRLDRGNGSGPWCTGRRACRSWRGRIRTTALVTAPLAILTKHETKCSTSFRKAARIAMRSRLIREWWPKCSAHPPKEPAGRKPRVPAAYDTPAVAEIRRAWFAGGMATNCLARFRSSRLARIIAHSTLVGRQGRPMMSKSPDCRAC